MISLHYDISQALSSSATMWHVITCSSVMTPYRLTRHCSFFKCVWNYYEFVPASTRIWIAVTWLVRLESSAEDTLVPSFLHSTTTVTSPSLHTFTSTRAEDEFTHHSQHIHPPEALPSGKLALFFTLIMDNKSANLNTFIV